MPSGYSYTPEISLLPRNYYAMLLLAGVLALWFEAKPGEYE